METLDVTLGPRGPAPREPGRVASGSFAAPSMADDDATQRPTEPDEDDLDRAMNAYADGEDQAFARIHAVLAPRLQRFFLRLGASTRESEDFLQETFFRIHRARSSFAAGSPALPWAYAIARNAFSDHIRRTRRSTSLLGALFGSWTHERAVQGPDVEHDATEAVDRVRVALDRLPPNQREAFVLLRFEGLSVSDAAEVLETSEGNVKVRATRAADAIRRALKGDGEEP